MRNATGTLQKGAVTHHHDQSIYPVNFNTTKATPKSPKTPTPPELFDELLDFLTVFFNFIKKFLKLIIPICTNWGYVCQN